MSIILDTHVHIYKNYSLDDFFKRADINFNDSLNKENLDIFNTSKILFLTERYDLDFFKNIREGKANLKDFEVLETKEENSLIIKDKNTSLILISGRQIISAENIELLALGLNSKIEDKKLELSQLIGEVRLKGAVAVIPWGFGKWLFKRKEVIKKVLENYNGRGLFLGDTSLRPKEFIIKNSLFKKAKHLKIKTLQGTDPLNLKNEENRVCKYCLYLKKETISKKTPFKDLSSILLNEFNESFLGERLSLIKVLKKQVFLRLRK